MIGILTIILTLAGVALILIGAIGMLRLPDVLCRSHAMTKALTLGIFFMLLGLWAFKAGDSAGLSLQGPGWKIILAIMFQILTIPISGHLVSRLAREKNLRRWRHRAMDDHRKRSGTSS